MQSKALVIAEGLHGPWNKGEVVLARNIIYILEKLYDKLIVISTVESWRGEVVSLKQSSSKIYYVYEPNIRNLVSKFITSEFVDSRFDVHLLNSLRLNPLTLIPIMKERIFLYQFTYRAFGNPSLRMYCTPLLASLGELTVVTTCANTYRKLSKAFRRNYYYIPAPLNIQSNLCHTRQKENTKRLRVIYIGHATPYRFPHNEVFNALAKLRNRGYDFSFNIYFTKIEWPNVDYMSFIKGILMRIKKLDLVDVVKLNIINLTEEEKYAILARNDVLLYPALREVAVDPPVSVLEGMAVGLCVVSTPVQSVPFILRDNRGIVLSGRNLESELYEALSTLLDKPETLTSYGCVASDYVKTFHSLEAVSKYLREIICA
jgi:glycosyltransferase involved in cell wall biosynthesis